MLTSLSRSSKALTLLSTPWRLSNGTSRQFPQEYRRAKSSTTNEIVNADVNNKTEQSQKLPPQTPSPEECCGTGCSDCTFLKYAEELVDHYKDGGAVALKEVKKIEDPGVRAFVEMEIKFYLDLDQDMRNILKATRQKSLDTKTNTQD